MPLKWWIIGVGAFAGGWAMCTLYTALVRALDRLFEPAPAPTPTPWSSDLRRRAIAVDMAEGDRSTWSGSGRAPAAGYAATGACAGCPYRGRCHSARQRAVDQSGLGLGRHTSCDFYREFERRARAGADVRPSVSERVGALLRCAQAAGRGERRP